MSAANGGPGPDGTWRYAKQKPTPGKVCKDCVEQGVASRRPAPHPGPRCTTHHNEARRNRRLAAKVRRVEKTYGLTGEEYDALYAFQGGRCAVCRRATGARKRLAVDHDHHQAMLDGHSPDTGCPRCVRGLVCSTCNDVLAHFRSDPAAGLRITHYLQRGPWRTFIDVGKAPVGYRSWDAALDGRGRSA